MMKRRAFLALAAAATLSACAEPLVDAAVGRELQVVSVDVDVSQLEQVSGRQITVPNERVERDVRATVLAQLRQGAVGTRPAKVAISLTDFHLVSPGQSLLLGGTSMIGGLITVTDATSGEVILAPTEVTGTAKGGYPLGGVIGAAVKASQTPEDDYKATVAGFAADVRRRLLGEES